MSEGRNPILLRIYALIGIVAILAGTAFTMTLIWDIWNPPFFKTKPAHENPKVAQMRALAQGIVKTDNYSIAYRNPEIVGSKDDFHNIAIPAYEDEFSLCITCHGLLPHYYNTDTRAFRNKHSSYIACETCHIGGEGSPSFGWYNTKIGTVLPRITIVGNLIQPDYKIGIFYGGRPGEYNKSDMIKAASKLLQESFGLDAATRKERIKPFHENLKTSDKAVTCKECHGGDDGQTSFLPLERLGYSKARINVIMRSEIIGMLIKYKEFYLPTFLTGSGAAMSDNSSKALNVISDNLSSAPAGDMKGGGKK